MEWPSQQRTLTVQQPSHKHLQTPALHPHPQDRSFHSPMTPRIHTAISNGQSSTRKSMLTSFPRLLMLSLSRWAICLTISPLFGAGTWNIHSFISWHFIVVCILSYHHPLFRCITSCTDSSLIVIKTALQINSMKSNCVYVYSWSTVSRKYIFLSLSLSSFIL